MKISIITATYNSSTYLEQCIQSIHNQDYPNIEHIIVDGGSTDETLRILNTYSSKITKLITEPDEGISDAFNKGIDLSTGDLIGIVSSDDWLAPNILKTIQQFYTDNNEPDIIHGNCTFWNIKTRNHFLSKPDPHFRSPYHGQPLKHGSVFVRKEIYERFGCFDKTLRCAMDYDLILRLHANKCRFAYLNRSIANIRTGGINEVLRSHTLIESREIAIRHGCPRTRAYLYWIHKNVKDIAKKFLKLIKLNILTEFYRSRHNQKSTSIK